MHGNSGQLGAAPGGCLHKIFRRKLKRFAECELLCHTHTLTSTHSLNLALSAPHESMQHIPICSAALKVCNAKCQRAFCFSISSHSSRCQLFALTNIQFSAAPRYLAFSTRFCEHNPARLSALCGVFMWRHLARGSSSNGNGCSITSRS